MQDMSAVVKKIEKTCGVLRDPDEVTLDGPNDKEQKDYTPAIVDYIVAIIGIALLKPHMVKALEKNISEAILAVIREDLDNLEEKERKEEKLCTS